MENYPFRSILMLSIRLDLLDENAKMEVVKLRWHRLSKLVKIQVCRKFLDFCVPITIQKVWKISEMQKWWRWHHLMGLFWLHSIPRILQQILKNEKLLIILTYFYRILPVMLEAIKAIWTFLDSHFVWVSLCLGHKGFPLHLAMENSKMNWRMDRNRTTSTVSSWCSLTR